MKKLIFLIVFLFSGFSMYAESNPVDFNKVKFGMGGGLGFSTAIYDDYGYYGYTIPTKVVMPVQIFKYFRFEPVFSLSVSKYNDNEHDESDTLTNFMGGGGFFFTYPFDSAMIIAGARIEGGANIYKSEDEGETRKRHRGVFLAEPVIGADYFLNSHFSIGCEITLSMVYMGETKYDDVESDDYEGETAFMIRTGGTLFFRFYFF
ncbi:MAG TPA: hypothetical protein PLD55_01420 [bacterium]|jgi:hypothetical protein|nr:hypothetical protein [bacterium]MDX9804204.1 hypothetical protein [bacterium]HNW15290.1 hypothetical protein [bacterium]HNZ52635.1 hypothetical protein [bacterium]HOB70208.1 hypothetical protein [bacterium]